MTDLPADPPADDASRARSAADDPTRPAPETDEPREDDTSPLDGPEPDELPWADSKRRRETEEEEEEEGEQEAGDDTAQDEGDEGATGPAGHVAGGPGAALEARPSLQIPRPPKRTGVFIDPDDLRVHVGDLLRAFLGSYQVDAFGNFTFSHEDARIFVTVGGSPIGPQVGVFSITNLDVDLTEPLGRYLLETNHRLGFGSFSYDADNHAVWLRHTLLGTMLDGPELQSAVAAIASTAAHFDDEIRERFGGRAFHDAPEDVQSAAKPPEPSDGPYPNAGGYL